MKKLTLLKPNKKTVYLNYGKGQEVNYLYVPSELKREVLEKDVKAGAAPFAECLKVAYKKPSKFVVVKCKNEEEGLMAVSYLAAAYNETEGRLDCDEEEHLWNCDEEHRDMEVMDYENLFNWDMEGNYEDEEGFWLETPYRIPLIDLCELRRYTNMSFSHIHFQDQNQFTSGVIVNPHKEPYWLTVKRESVCILATGYNEPEHFMGPSGTLEGLCKELKRFENNRHVYVVIVSSADYETEAEQNKAETEYFETVVKEDRQNICEVVLEYTATMLEVNCKEADLEKYHTLLFENWASALGVSLAKGFPKAEMTKRITAMRNPSKSDLMEKVYKYVLAQEHIGEVLNREDFAILKKFRLLGIDDGRRDNTSIKKMETSLVGLEEVKKQVYSIVDVMKYNKKRMQLGLGNGGYHNVHLMIGAPGTAKTTVAQFMGNIMKEQKLLPGNRFIAINGADLKGMFVGHSAPKTRAYFEEYDVILIDEAYSVASGDHLDSFSEEAIAQLIIELERHGMDKLVIFAGYGGMNVNEKDNKMIQFLNANPGIRSRINSTIYFESYTPEQMVDIVHCHAKNLNYLLDHKADALIQAHFEQRYKLPDFGNGREARSLLENITREAAVRMMHSADNKMTKKAMQELTCEDVSNAIKKVQKTYEMQNGKKRRNCGFEMKED